MLETLANGFYRVKFCIVFVSFCLKYAFTLANLVQVEERTVGVDELAEADEVFCTGTAVGVAPVGSITYQNKR